MAESGAVLVTGLARGVDTAATLAALQAGGEVIGVLPEGIDSAIRIPLRRFVADGRLLVISEFERTAPWTVGNAMKRNRTICALGCAMFVIEAGTSGGTLAAGRTALKMQLPLYAIAYPDNGAGNDILLTEGATALRRDSELRAVLYD